MKKHTLYMAPIRGVTNCIYRNQYSLHFSGYDVAVAPFINSCIIENVKSRAVRDLFTERNRADFDIIPQILGNDAAEFISLASMIYDMGYPMVNWNLGCPHRRVINKGRGSGLLSTPDRIVQLLESIIPAIPNTISIKVRLGKEDPAELAALLPMLNDFPLKEIIVHPRTGKQMYKGVADTNAFRDIMALTNHELVYNGDIDSHTTFLSLVDMFPTINKWMIGRYGIRNPFLPEQIRGDSDLTQSELVRRFHGFHDAIFSTYENEVQGPAHLLAKMKECWLYWSESFERGGRLLKKISKISTINAYSNIVENMFCSNPDLVIKK